jgi:Tol biopolymer transport system component
MGGLDWSPDGQWVYFGITNGRYASAYRVHPDGTALTFIGPPNMDWASDVAVSDDGQWIVYKHAARSSSGSYLGRGGIWAMRIDGSENHQISVGQAGSCGPGWPVDDYDPEWSPDRQQVVFSALNATTCGWDIVRINADGTNRTTVFASTSSSTWNFIPDWNDNGILFTEMVLMVPQYYGGTIIQPDGSGKTRVGGNGGYVRWIPSTLAPSTPTPIAPVGGIAELSSGSGSEESTDAWVLGVTLGAALALGLGAWHVRRRWLHRKA